MVDDSNIFTFISPADLSSDIKYSLEWWVFKPEIDGKQFGKLVLNLGEEVNHFTTITTLDEAVLPFEWHSFCISINVARKQATVVHNGHIQLIQIFEEIKDNLEDKDRFLTSGNIGGAKFVGTLVNFEVFGRPFSDEELFQWTLFQNKEHFILFLILNILTF